MTPLLITLLIAQRAAIAAGPSPHECALLALTGIAEAEGLRLGAGHWRLARIVGEQAATCELASSLARSMSRNWMSADGISARAFLRRLFEAGKKSTLWQILLADRIVDQAKWEAEMQALAC